MELKVLIHGATDEECQRGLAAAMVVFQTALVTPLEAASAAFNRPHGRGIDGGPITQRCLEAADAWDSAQYAAADAACEGWASPVQLAYFELVRHEAYNG